MVTSHSGVRLDAARPIVGVDAPWLVISPPEIPTIRLDARLLDRVELIGRSSRPPLAASVAASGLAIAGIAASGLSQWPAGPLACAGLAYLSFERFREARRRERSRDLLLGLGQLEVALHIGEGMAAAKAIVSELAPYTRTAAITRHEVYEDAKGRLRARAEGNATVAANELSSALVVGNDAVFVKDDCLHIGAVSFRVAVVRGYALRGENLPLPRGKQLQAALGLLVVAAQARAAAGEDLAALAKRVAEYEAWTGHSAAR